MRNRMLLASFLLSAISGASACGGGKDDADNPPPQPAAAAPAGGAAAPKSPKDALQVYTKVEDVVPEDEVATIRHKFRERDFGPDLTGDENRDPFQSFVIVQPGVGQLQNPAQPQTATPSCSAKQQVAGNYALRDLRLAAIITRGLRRFALFQDTADIGHLATKLDCLGKEKARVKEIGERTVTLELVPEQAPNQPPHAPEEKSIPLYPSELPLGAVDNQGGGPDDSQPTTNTTIPPPPSTGPMLRNVPPDDTNHQ
jgi:Tfp pilus assembly protein PilP